MTTKRRLSTVIGLLTVTAILPVGLTGAARAQGAAEKPSNPKATKVPASVVGEWFWGTVSPSYYVDRNTGEFLGNSSGGGSSFVFKADGTYQRYVLIQTRLGGSTSEIFAVSQGTVVFDEAKGTFTLRPTKGNYTFTDNKKQRKRPMEKDELERAGLEFTYRLAKEDGKTYLFIARKGEKPDEARRYSFSKEG
jgi:hypothetical protein